MIENGDTLVLTDDKEYMVVSKAIIDNITYLYLVNDDAKKPSVIFGKLDNEKITKVTDSELLEKLIIEFKKDIE